MPERYDSGYFVAFPARSTWCLPSCIFWCFPQRFGWLPICIRVAFDWHLPVGVAYNTGNPILPQRRGVPYLGGSRDASYR